MYARPASDSSCGWATAPASRLRHARLGYTCRLDGNPDPIVTSAHTAILRTVADEIAQRKDSSSPLLVAIHGIDGSGKVAFADKLSPRLQQRGASVVAERAMTWSGCRPQDPARLALPSPGVQRFARLKAGQYWAT